MDNEYRNAYKEVYVILQNTDEELIKMLPKDFLDFLQNNMNEEYETNIDVNLDIDKQKILPQTNETLAYIYRRYWATDEEKQKFSNNDKLELEKIEKYEQNQCKDIEEIFKERQNLSNISVKSMNNPLAIVEKEGLITKLIKKVLIFLKLNLL